MSIRLTLGKSIRKYWSIGRDSEESEAMKDTNAEISRAPRYLVAICAFVYALLGWINSTAAVPSQACLTVKSRWSNPMWAASGFSDTIAGFKRGDSLKIEVDGVGAKEQVRGVLQNAAQKSIGEAIY